MHVQLIPLERIADNDDRRTYANLAELVDLSRRSALVGTICSEIRLPPNYLNDLLLLFHQRNDINRGHFKAHEMEVVDVVYGTLERYKMANDKYAREGYREDLTHLVRKIDELSIPPSRFKSKFRGGKRASFRHKISGIENGTMISEPFFDSIADYVNRLPEARREKLIAELRMLKDVFLMMFNTAGIVAENDGYFGAD